MTTKTIYVLMSLIAVAALAASLEVTNNPKVTKNPPAVHGTSFAVETTIDLEGFLVDLQNYKSDFKSFYDKLFKLYHSSSGHDLKVLGEALSYSGEIDTTLESIPTIMILAGATKSQRDAVLIVQNWIDHAKSSMTMRSYFIQRMVDDPGLDSSTAEMMELLKRQLEGYQNFLNRMKRALVRTDAVPVSQPAETSR